MESQFNQIADIAAQAPRAQVAAANEQDSHRPIVGLLPARWPARRAWALRLAASALIVGVLLGRGFLVLRGTDGSMPPPPAAAAPSAGVSAPATVASPLGPPATPPPGRQGSGNHLARADDLPSCSVNLGPISVDPCQWVTQAFLALLGWSVDLVTSGLTSAISAIEQSDIFLGTPHALADQNPAVVRMTGLMQVLALAGLTVVVAIGGFTIMLRPHVGLSSYELVQFLPRVLVGGLAIVAIGWVCGQLIDFANLLSAAGVTGALLPVSAPSLAGLGDGGDPSLGLLLLAFVVLGYALLALLVAIQLLIRLATLDVLLALAPLAAACWVLPQTQRWAERWAAFFVGTLLIQPLQLITVSLGLSIATSVPQTPSLAALFGNLNLQVIEGLLCLAAYYVAFRIPRLLTQVATGSSTLGVLATAALIGGSLLRTGLTLSGLAAGAGGGGGGAASAAGTGGGASGGAGPAGGAGGAAPVAGGGPAMGWPAMAPAPPTIPRTGGGEGAAAIGYTELQAGGQAGGESEVLAASATPFPAPDTAAGAMASETRSEAGAAGVQAAGESDAAAFGAGPTTAGSTRGTPVPPPAPPGGGISPGTAALGDGGPL